MRYGRIFSGFWAWAKEKGLSQDAIQLACFLMTCEAGNALGAFRLPDGYVAEDFAWSHDRVRITFSILAQPGVEFVRRAGDWVVIRDHLQHNPPESSKNAAGILAKFRDIPKGEFRALVAQCAIAAAGDVLQGKSPEFFAELEAASKQVRTGIERASNGHRTGIEAGSIDDRSPDPDPIPTPTPTHDPNPTRAGVSNSDPECQPPPSGGSRGIHSADPADRPLATDRDGYPERGPDGRWSPDCRAFLKWRGERWWPSLFVPLGATEGKCVEKRLREGYTFQDCQDAAEGAHLSEYHRERAMFDIPTVFGDKHFGRLLELGRKHRIAEAEVQRYCEDCHAMHLDGQHVEDEPEPEDTRTPEEIAAHADLIAMVASQLGEATP